MNYSMIKNIAVFRNSLLLLLLFVNFVAHAAKVDTVLVHSAAMNKDIKVVVVVPQIEGSHPVAYLLQEMRKHGLLYVRIWLSWLIGIK